MAEHTVTALVLDDGPEVSGRRKKVRYSLDITAAGADGYSITAKSGVFTHFRQLTGFKVVSQENGGYVMQFIPTSLPAAGEFLGNGKVRVYEEEAVAAGGALVEVTTGDLGVFIVELEGY